MKNFKRGDIAIFTPKNGVRPAYKVVILDYKHHWIDYRGEAHATYLIHIIEIKDAMGTWTESCSHFYSSSSIEDLHEPEEYFNNQKMITMEIKVGDTVYFMALGGMKDGVVEQRLVDTDSDEIYYKVKGFEPMVKQTYCSLDADTCFDNFKIKNDNDGNKNKV